MERNAGGNQGPFQPGSNPPIRRNELQYNHIMNALNHAINSMNDAGQAPSTASNLSTESARTTFWCHSCQLQIQIERNEDGEVQCKCKV